MRYLDLTLSTLVENLALDEALLRQAEEQNGWEVLRTWEWPSPAVVLGAGGRIALEVDEAACQAHGVPILRRASGGGTVLIGPGCLLFSLVLAHDPSSSNRAIHSSYTSIRAQLAKALSHRQAEIRPEGISDLALDGRKISGSAQQRLRRYFLHHGTVLHSFDSTVVGRYLRHPARQPEYRQDRPHEAFLANLALSAAEIKKRLRSAWGAGDLQQGWPEQRVATLCRDKYNQPAWIRRR